MQTIDEKLASIPQCYRDEILARLDTSTILGQLYERGVSLHGAYDETPAFVFHWSPIPAETDEYGNVKTYNIKITYRDCYDILSRRIDVFKKVLRVIRDQKGIINFETFRKYAIEPGGADEETYDLIRGILR